MLVSGAKERGRLRVEPKVWVTPNRNLILETKAERNFDLHVYRKHFKQNRELEIRAHITNDAKKRTLLSFMYEIKIVGLVPASS